MTTKREQAKKLLAPIFLPEVLPAILDAIEIMGQPEPEPRQEWADCAGSRGAEEPAPEPEYTLDTLRAERDALLEALESITDELGVPQPMYPQPVANAYEIARAAIRKVEP